LAFIVLFSCAALQGCDSEKSRLEAERTRLEVEKLKREAEQEKARKDIYKTDKLRNFTSHKDPD